MTPTRWFIVIFWVVVIVMCAKSFYDYNNHVSQAQAAQAEQHWFPPPLPGAAPAHAQSQDADVRQVSYVVSSETPHSALFTANLTIKNFGLKKAINIQVRVLPYVGTTDSKTQPGPDEIQNPTAVDAQANNFQWIEFADLAPGQSATQTLTFPTRYDASPRTRFEPKITFETAKDKP